MPLGFDETRLLLDLSRDVSATLDLQEVLDHSLAALRKLIAFDGGSVQLVERDALLLSAADPCATAEARSVRIPRGKGVGWQVVSTGEPCYIPDITVDLRVFPQGLKDATSPGVRSWFGVPLILRGEAIGIVQIDSTEADAFPERARALVLAFVPTIAAAVQNAMIFRQEQEVSARLREAEAIKNDFLAMVSHELRTPLTSVLGFAETLVDRGESLSPPLVAEISRRIRSSSRRLAGLVEDLLSVAQVARGEFTIRSEPVALEPILRDLVAGAGEDPHPMKIDVEPGLPLVAGDADRIVQVLANLIDNARKFSAPGTLIAIEARREGDRVAISVTDRGRGIPEDLVGRVFERFVQVDPSTARWTGGMGIGLYLVKQLCDRMGAEIRVWSRVGIGSRFTILLRRSAGDRATPARAATSV